MFEKTLQKKTKMIKIDITICLNYDFLKKNQANVNWPMHSPSSCSVQLLHKPLVSGRDKIKTKQVILNEGAQLRTGLQTKCAYTGETCPNLSGESRPIFFLPTCLQLRFSHVYRKCLVYLFLSTPSANPEPALAEVK